MPSTIAEGTEKKATETQSDRAQTDKRFKALNVTMKRNHYRQDSLIEVLHKAQESFGYLEPEVLEFVARGLKLPLSQVYGVATFYHLFSLKPSGKHNCVVCMGTACYVKGGGKIIEKLEESLGIKLGETSEDGKVSLLSVRCIGACAIAPAVVFDGTITPNVNPEIALERVKQWQEEE